MGYSQTNNRLTKRAPDPEPPNGAGEHRDRLVGACPVPSGPGRGGKVQAGSFLGSSQFCQSGVISSRLVVELVETHQRLAT